MKMLKDLFNRRLYTDIRPTQYRYLIATHRDGYEIKITPKDLLRQLPTLHPDDRILADIGLALQKEDGEERDIGAKIAALQEQAAHAAIRVAQVTAAHACLRRPTVKKHGDPSTSLYIGFHIFDEPGDNQPVVRLTFRKPHIEMSNGRRYDGMHGAAMTEKELLDLRDKHPHHGTLADRQIMHDALIALRLYKAENGFPVERIFNPRENFIRAVQEKSGDPDFRDFTIKRENNEYVASFRVHPHLDGTYVRIAPGGASIPAIVDSFNESALVARRRRLEKWGEPYRLAEQALEELRRARPHDTGGDVVIY
jgi:hypothetical protein